MIEKDYCITFIPILESGRPNVLNCQQVFLKLSESKANSLQKMFEADNKRYEETLFGLSYCTTPEPEKSVYENMINMNEKTITQCSEWLKRLEDVQDR